MFHMSLPQVMRERADAVAVGEDARRAKELDFPASGSMISIRYLRIP
jgi:hypothetical protein